MRYVQIESFPCFRKSVHFRSKDVTAILTKWSRYLVIQQHLYMNMIMGNKFTCKIWTQNVSVHMCVFMVNTWIHVIFICVQWTYVTIVNCFSRPNISLDLSHNLNSKWSKLVCRVMAASKHFASCRPRVEEYLHLAGADAQNEPEVGHELLSPGLLGHLLLAIVQLLVAGASLVPWSQSEKETKIRL